MVSSDGDMVFDDQPMVRLGVSAVAKAKGRTEQGSSGGGGRFGVEYFDRVPRGPRQGGRPRGPGELDSREAPAGTLLVVLGPGDSGILLYEAVGHGLEADFNRKETSNYTGQIGALHAPVTVVDAPRIAGERGSINVDDEGVVPRTHRLIVNGKLRRYLYDKISARHWREAHGERTASELPHVPMPRMSNTYMEAGQDALEDIVKSVKRGVYAVRFSGGQVNISNGDFVFSLTEGYLIENGKITAPLKGANLIGNGPEALGTVSMVGHDFKLSDGMWTCGKDGQSVLVGWGCPPSNSTSSPWAERRCRDELASNLPTSPRRLQAVAEQLYPRPRGGTRPRRGGGQRGAVPRGQRAPRRGGPAKLPQPRAEHARHPRRARGDVGHHGRGPDALEAFARLADMAGLPRRTRCRPSHAAGAKRHLGGLDLLMIHGAHRRREGHLPGHARRGGGLQARQAHHLLGGGGL